MSESVYHKIETDYICWKTLRCMNPAELSLSDEIEFQCSSFISVLYPQAF